MKNARLLAKELLAIYSRSFISSFQQQEIKNQLFQIFQKPIKVERVLALIAAIEDAANEQDLETVEDFIGMAMESS